MLFNFKSIPLIELLAYCGYKFVRCYSFPSSEFQHHHQSRQQHRHYHRHTHQPLPLPLPLLLIRSFTHFSVNYNIFWGFLLGSMGFYLSYVINTIMLSVFMVRKAYRSSSRSANDRYIDHSHVVGEDFPRIGTKRDGLVHSAEKLFPPHGTPTLDLCECSVAEVVLECTEEWCICIDGAHAPGGPSPVGVSVLSLLS